MPFPFLAPLIGLGASFLGGLGGDKSKSSQTSTTTPTLAREFQPLQQLLIQQAMQRLQGGGNLQGYQAEGISGINKSFGLADMALQNRLRARGLSRSPVAASADNKLQGERFGQIAQFNNTLPLLERDMQTEDIGLASSLLGFGRGQTTQGNAQGVQGGGLGGGFQDFGSMLGYLIGMGAFKKGGK